MTLANILVHIDSHPRAAVRLALARKLVDRGGARLTGVFAEVADARQVGVVAVWPSERYAQARRAAQALFERETAGLGERAAFIDVNRGGEAEILSRVADLARSFDLIVLGQTEDDAVTPASLPQHLITESGRPVLVAPFVGAYPDIGHRILFAWRPSRGAARALADARLVASRDCEGLVVEIARAAAPPDEFSSLVIANLASHGVRARYQRIVGEDIGVMDTLLNAAADHSADLLAIGGFDAGAFALLGRGAGTRFVLDHMTMPVLFSH